MNIISTLFDFFMPKSCLYCGDYGRYVCDKCFAALFEANHDDVRCEGIEKTYIGFRYNRAIELLWHEAKHNGYYEIAREAGMILKKQVEKRFPELLEDNYTFVPVPLSKEKQRDRGFNQVEIMLQGMGVEYVDLLERVKNTKTQVGLNRNQRIKNLNGAFQVKSEYRDKLPKKIVLVDDVYTTGTTIRFCAEVLKDLGVEEVETLVFAKG